MLRLAIKRDNYWIDITEGARVQVRPPSAALWAQAVALAPRIAEEDEPRDVAFVRAVARLAIVEWEGIGDEAGNPLPVTPEAVDALLALPAAFAAFQHAYVEPAFVLEAEKNA